MGSPGCGKTTAAVIVGQRLGMPVIDVDDYLESFWNKSVAAKVLVLLLIAQCEPCLVKDQHEVVVSHNLFVTLTRILMIQ